MSTQPTTTAILDRWLVRRDEWERLHVQVDGAALAAEVIADIERLDSAAGDESLTLAQASDRCGYSTDHLSRLVREGKLKNLGRKGAPRVRAADLPRRVAARSNRSYDPSADARSLGIRR
jgi:hypothetical protein